MKNLNRQINVDELDFDSIKASIKEFFRGQSNFSDFEFEGSALNVLMDVLAYNTHYNSLYTNLAVNEMFIDSASKLSSVTSLAKTIGYTPRSTLASKAKINLYISNVPGNPGTLTLPKNTSFKSELDGVEYTFLTPESTTVTRLGLNQYYFQDLEIIQGFPLTQSYIVSDTTNFVIPERNVDMTKVAVTVYAAPGNSEYETFTQAEDVLSIKTTDPVYFVKQREDLNYELFFGNDAIGKKLNNGNLVVIEYYSTSGDVANGCKDFYYSGGFAGDYYYNATTVQSAIDGAPAEERDSIKFNAPRFYKAQHRAVTAGDYEVVLMAQYPIVESVKVWGGEDNHPPIYGKVFISAKPYSRETFTELEKLDMIRWLRSNRTPLTVLPEFVDAATLNIELTTSVYYDPSSGNISAADLKTIVHNTIEDYSLSLNQFNVNFLYSRLVSSIDASHDAITNNISKLRVRNTVKTYSNVDYKYEFNFMNPIRNNGSGGNVWTTRFLCNKFEDRVYIKDEADGSLWMYTEDIYGISTQRIRVGYVDYRTGFVSFETNFRNYYDFLLEVVFEPQSYDVLSINNYILTMPMERVTINMISDKSNIISAIR